MKILSFIIYPHVTQKILWVRNDMGVSDKWQQKKSFWGGVSL